MGCLISLFKTCFKLLDTGIYIADVLSDFANAILYYKNCHFNYFYFSIGTLILSYITTVIYLTFIVHHKEKWYRALFYPYCLMEITWKKFLSHCPFLNDDSKKLTPSPNFRHQFFNVKVSTHRWHILGVLQMCPLTSLVKYFRSTMTMAPSRGVQS